MSRRGLAPPPEGGSAGPRVALAEVRLGAHYRLNSDIAARLKVPISDTARERRGLVEGHTYPLVFAPDDVTRNVRALHLKDKIETIGDVAGVSNFERRPRNGNVAD